MPVDFTPTAFTAAQWRNFMAIADTLFPAMTPQQVQQILASLPQGKGNKEAIENFLSRSASDCTEVAESLDGVFLHRIPSDTVTKIKMVLGFLDGGILTVLLTRQLGSFSRLPLESRTRVLQNWSQSWIPLFRDLHRQLQLLFANTILKANPLLVKAIEYPLFPPTYAPESNDPLSAFCSTPAPPFHKPTFHQFDDTPEDDTVELSSDIVIVGSGAGGGVCAATIARELIPEGYSVTILDKAGFTPPTKFPLQEVPLAKLTHENDGVISTRDGHGLVVTGSTWGGTTTINWGLSLDLEGPVKQEWKTKYGLGDVIDGDDWSDCANHVKIRMGVSTPEEKHMNTSNKLIWEGATKLGMEPKAIPQNCGGRMDEHSKCGYCSGGCRSGCKQGTAVSWLVDAEKAGAKCITGVEIERIIWNDSQDGTKVAKGVEGYIVSVPSLEPTESPRGKRKIRILSSCVIVSAGTLRTPTILSNSGLTNLSIGRNLRMHPCIFTVGITDQSRPLNPWTGFPTTVLVPSSTNKEEIVPAKLMRMDPPPSMSLTCLPWYEPTSYIKNILSYKHMVNVLTLIRDTDSSGYVDPRGTKTAVGEAGPPDITYNFTKKDKETGIDGIILACKVLLEGGCRTVIPCIPLPTNLAQFTVPPETTSSPTTTPEFQAYAAALKRYGIGQGFVSGHLMGTARWGGSAADGSVCDGKKGGKVWGSEGVYVVDGSAFPTASGVNPMLTIMTLAEWAGRRIVEQIRVKKKGEYVAATTLGRA